MGPSYDQQTEHKSRVLTPGVLKFERRSRGLISPIWPLQWITWNLYTKVISFDIMFRDLLEDAGPLGTEENSQVIFGGDLNHILIQ